MNSMDKATSKRALPQAGVKASGQALTRQALAREAEEGTRERILRTAERLFAERGFGGVSVRELAAAAQVNIASIGYHFDNKEGLLSEVYRRHCEPMIEERLRGLAASSRLRGKARVAAIIEAFIRPALQQVEVEGGEAFIRLRAVLSGENSELL
jgi:AcrR family transcriptional regulator